MSGTRVEDQIQPEILIAKYHPKRAASLITYLMGILAFLLGWSFMVMSSIQFVESTLVAWYIGLWSMTIGCLLILWAEIRRRYTLYAITSWAVRVRKGFYNQITTRVFLDEISQIETNIDQEERIVNQGDVEIYVKDEDQPALVLQAIDNPRGVLEIVRRLVKTLPDPIPWDHIERTRTISYG
ncbi:MAG: PH domain-containing protein [Candidatus Thorarchaeota archaeon]|jgi:hypothetical protein